MIKVSKIQIPALPTAQPRRLYVYLPRDYKRSERRYPVLYMFDGHNVFYDSHATYGKSWGMKEYLEKTKLPLILVAVECNLEGNRRLFEYAPWDFSARGLGKVQGLGKVTMDWFTQVLKSEIDRTYRTLPDREHTLIAGSSMGGIMALYAGVAYRDVFSRAACVSPCLWVDRRALFKLIRETDLTGSRLYLDFGSEEEERDLCIKMEELMFTTARELTAAGADVTALVAPGARHSEAYWEKRIPVFMDYLLG